MCLAAAAVAVVVLADTRLMTRKLQQQA